MCYIFIQFILHVTKRLWFDHSLVHFVVIRQNTYYVFNAQNLAVAAVSGTFAFLSSFSLWLHIYFRLIWVLSLCQTHFKWKYVFTSTKHTHTHTHTYMYCVLRCVLFKCLILYLYLSVVCVWVSFPRNLDRIRTISSSRLPLICFTSLENVCSLSLFFSYSMFSICF